MPPAIPLPWGSLDPESHTLVMGIINTTPDSFSDGGKHFQTDIAVESALQMFRAGADIVDVGGESTRPGSMPVSVEEELARAVPVIRGICEARPGSVVSVDTRRCPVAEAAIQAGAAIINDVSGLRDDPAMVDVARDAGCAVVIMHMLGRPRTMQQEIHYDSFPGDIYDFLASRVQALETARIDPAKIVVDPGIGFGKTFDQNLVLLNRVDFFRGLGKHILIAPSRKAFIGKILDQPDASARDTGTLAAIVAAVLRGASIVRVHDVPSSVQACRVADAILRERITN